ncbi:MAG: hypothetical protein ACJ72Q_19905 [Nitrososphaeraceae archaeon]
MKKFNIEFFVPIIPALAVIASALLAAVITTIFSFFCSSVNIANAHSNAFSPPPPPPSSPLQSQQQEQQHQPSVMSSPVKSLLSQQQQQQQQQQQNQLSNQQQRHHQPLLNTNGTNNINTPGNRLPTSAPPLSFRTEFPEPLCYFNTDPLFCPHYLWHLE